MPSTMPIDDPAIQSELTRYLSDNWVPVIESDVDGPNSLPKRIDEEVSNLGRIHATRRVARTIYLGSAPKTDASQKGIEDRRIRLGCVMPGETPALFGDALRRLAATATYLYQDGPRAWYSTQPTVTKLADDRAEQLRRDPDKIYQELENRIRADIRTSGGFSKVYPFPRSTADVPDELETRLVVLSSDHPFQKEPGSAAETIARSFLETRGNAPRIYRNTLVFLAPDKTRLPDLDESLRKFIAWKSILDERDSLGLTPFQERQAQTQLEIANGSVNTRIPEVFQWLLVPFQPNPETTTSIQNFRLTGNEAIAAKAMKKLQYDESLVTILAPTILRTIIDKIPLWRRGMAHVSVKELAEDFAKYLYLPRLSGPLTLTNSIMNGVKSFTWEAETFALAELYDEASDAYKGINAGEGIAVLPESSLLVLKPDRARAELNKHAATTGNSNNASAGNTPAASGTKPVNTGSTGHGVAMPARFFGTIALDPIRMSRDAGKIAEEVVAHITSLVGSKVEITLEIKGDFPEGVPDSTRRIVLENARSLGFLNQEFE